MLKVNPPFSISAENFSLLPGKSAKVRIDFDPAHKNDFVSGVTNGKLQIFHIDHPHREFVDLIGEVCFPNLKLESNTISFGSILNDTLKKVVISMKNISEMALNYDWHFLEEDLQVESTEIVAVKKGK